MNTVEVDDEAIAAELKLLEGEHIPAGEMPPGAQPGAAPGPDAGASTSSPPAMDWTMPAGLVVFVFDKIVAPNWELEAVEKQMLHEQVVGTLQAFFPTVNLDPRIVALLGLGGALVAITGKRIDLETGKIKPLRPPAPEPEADHPAAPEQHADAGRKAA